ncbi:phage tail spike protein [Halalkalibacterium halodurans]|uniref:phage tail spike protein n=1 Tax=Halalkalibacterium halodurans TaxID=86665 RepID=UPI002E1BD34C|nr:phage tail spike protein [Halalkalibacterium halodurans]MED4083865.1 phage tail spike protein [Halalkalibacterium halodurans]MED4105502.1 phage tail spike protein [Halalkalibacterium halodurans]MED4109292.1 phage tail spike protein [Halalkalibacterium halodurans]MED4149694.1 phage tail spike protein [Halalkalibacterium halodurans]
MYTVTIYEDHTDTQGLLIHSPYVDDLKVSHGKIQQVTEGIPNFTLEINPKNPAWNRLRPLKTLIRVRNVKTGKEEFAGRVLKPTQAMRSDGMLTIRYECEGFMAYLQDSNQRHGEFHDITVRDFLQVIVDNHNSQVESHKRMKLGTVTVTNSTDNVYRYLGYEKTFETIKDKLIDRLGGYLKLREEPDGFYLDYLETVGEVKNTAIRLRRNLKEMQREIDPTGVITRVIPLGERIESDDEEATDASQARLTIESVNGGIDYLDDLDMQAEFGIIEGTIIYDDITQPNILKTRGEQFLAAQKAAKISYSVTALDLSLIDASMDSFEIDNFYPIINPLFNIEEQLQVIEKDIDINEPTNSSLVIGEQYRTLTQYQVEANKRMRQVEDLQSVVDSQMRTIGQLKNEVSTVESGLQQVEQALADGDIPALQDAIQNLTDAVDNLTDAVNAIQPVTETTDGLMLATDKVKLNRITVLNTVDLDDLVQRVRELEDAVFGNGGNGNGG